MLSKKSEFLAFFLFLLISFQNCQGQTSPHVDTTAPAEVTTSEQKQNYVLSQQDTAKGKINWSDYRLEFDNRKQAGDISPYTREALRIVNETKECNPGDTFVSCNSTPGFTLLVNPPRLPANDWSEAGQQKAAGLRYNTHVSGMYVKSYGREAIINGKSIIAPSGIHLEPHGSHQGLRIDGTVNSGINLRVDLSKGGTGIAVFTGSKPSPYCEVLDLNCQETTLMDLRGGDIKLKDVRLFRSVSVHESMNIQKSTKTMGVESFSHWHLASSNSVPTHCVFNSAVTKKSILRISNYKASKNLLMAHSYNIKDVWGPGEAPADCKAPQLIKTATHVYGQPVPADAISSAGFSVSVLGAEGVLNPLEWATDDRPSFLYEIIEPLN